jgi:PKD repeat protein
VTCTDLSCSYNGSASSDPDGDTLQYAWDFGDTASGSGVTTTHEYSTGGPRTVTLTVTDPSGETDSTTRSINPQPPANQPPTAAATITCDLLACSFDASGSDDPDGTISKYDWDFGDGETGTGETTSHTYGSAGAKTVTLTVTDNADATASKTFNISPTAQASPLTYVGTAGTNGNRVNHAVTIPNNVQAGDALVLFFAANTTAPTYTGPAGWTQLESSNGDGIVGRAYTKVATAADAGSSVKVTSSAYAKSDTSLSAYRGTSADSPVAVSAGRVDNSAGASHTSPTVTAPAGNNWLVTYWADKSGSTSAWNPPGGHTTRTSQFGTSTGHVSGLLVDSNDTVSGSVGGLTATANSTSSRGVSFSVVLH